MSKVKGKSVTVVKEDLHSHLNEVRNEVRKEEKWKMAMATMKITQMDLILNIL